MSWSKNNIADMDTVTKTAAGSPNQIRRSNAEAVATQLDMFFVGIYKTVYENISDTVTKSQAKAAAISALTDILANANEKLKAAGDIVDEHYLFKGEVE